MTVKGFLDEALDHQTTPQEAGCILDVQSEICKHAKDFGMGNDVIHAKEMNMYVLSNESEIGQRGSLSTEIRNKTVRIFSVSCKVVMSDQTLVEMKENGVKAIWTFGMGY